MRTIAQPPTVLPQANDPCWCGSGRKYKRCHKKSEGRVLPGMITPMRNVPAHIVRPSYADTGVVEHWDEPRIKSPGGHRADAARGQGRGRDPAPDR